MSEDKLYSTSALATKLGMEYKDLVRILLSLQYAIRGASRKLVLTEVGMVAGGKVGHSEKYGAFVQWPENLELNIVSQDTNTQLKNESAKPDNRKPPTQKSITGGSLAKQLNLDVTYINDVACILGWASKVRQGNGYYATGVGFKQGMNHSYSAKYDTAYLLFPENILSNEAFKICVEIFKHLERNNIGLYTGSVESVQTMTVDGHVANSIYHCIIDNWLLFHSVTHIVNSRSPLPESDFFLPALGLSITFNMNEEVESIPVVVDGPQSMMLTFNPKNIVHIDAVMKKAMFSLNL